MIRRGSLVGVSVAAAVLGAVAGLDACGSDKLAGSGGECFVADDCQPGLVCIEQKNGGRICTSDLTAAAGTVPPDGAAPADAESGDAAREDGSTPRTDSGSPPTNDAGSPPPPPPPPQDAGPTDAGSDGG